MGTLHDILWLREGECVLVIPNLVIPFLRGFFLPQEKTYDEGLIRPFFKKGVHCGVRHDDLLFNRHVVFDFRFNRLKVAIEFFPIPKRGQSVNAALIRGSVGGIPPPGRWSRHRLCREKAE